MILQNLQKLSYKFKLILRSILSFILALFIVFPVSAEMSESTLNSLYDNGVYYYNPEGIVGGCLTGSANLAGSNNEEWLWSGLVSLGFTEFQTAGIMGNMAHESNFFNPVQHEKQFQDRGWETAYNNPSISYGIGLIQWSWGRRVEILHSINDNYPDLIKYFQEMETYSPGYQVTGAKFTELAGENITKELYSIELQFLKDERDGGGWEGEQYQKFLNESSSAEEAAKSFRKYVERGGTTDTGRINSAVEYYNKYNGMTFGSSSSSGCVNSGGLQELVLKYAWPTHHSAPFIERMPDYAAAVSRRQSEGKYVGGSVNGVAGIDCGGFVTTLLQDSGFAPDYNSGGENTFGQENWVKSHGWTLLNGSSSSPIDSSILQPGDVAFTNGHTFVYVGEISGFESNIASASYGTSLARAPMAGTENLIKQGRTGEIVRWYRKASN